MKKYLLLLTLMGLGLLPVHAASIDGVELAKNFYKLVLQGDTKTIVSAFSKTPNIDTPRTGAIKGKKAFVEFLEQEKAWLLKNGIDVDSIREIKITQSQERIVYEQNLTLNNRAPASKHNFAVVVDLHKGKAKAVRVYYIYAGISGRKDFSRPAMLENDPSLLEGIAAPVKQYVTSIENAYTDVYRMFPDKACFGPFCGVNRAKFFVIAMQGGSVPLRLTTATCDAVTCALEENLASWGDTQFSFNTGGLAVYDYNDKGQVTDARVYDDIHENPFGQPGWFAKNWSALSKGFREAGCPLNTAPELNDPPQVAWGKVMMQPCAAN